jgi:hypothetical protein
MLRKAIVQMKKNTKKNVLRVSFICLLIVAIAVGILAIPRGQNAGYAAPYIQLMNNAPAINLKDYLDSSVMFGLSDKISLHIGDCKETLVRLRSEMGLSEDSSEGRPGTTDKLYDIVYIDANKREYCEYYDLVFDMIRPGGLILADNVIWDGKVCMDPLPQDKQTLGIVRFNDMVSADPRVESVILPLRDGLNVIRKK